MIRIIHGEVPGALAELADCSIDACVTDPPYVACRTKLGKSYHVDHIISLVAGGSNDRTNLQLLCGPCNHGKHAKDPIRFMQSRGFLL